MARDRFSELDRIYETLKQAKVDIDTLPQNLEITRYAKWKEGDAPERTIQRPSLGASVDVGVIAFGLPDTDDASKIQVDWNTRALNFFNGLANNSLFGIETASLATYNENPSFVPAKVALTVRGSKIPATSDITGAKYQKNQGASYTIPIGQTTAVKHFQEAVQGLLSSAIATGHFISASPEEWRRD